MQLTLSFGSLTAPVIAIAVARAAGNPLTPLEIGACVLAGVLSILTVHVVATRRAVRRSLGAARRLRRGRRAARSECGFVDSQIRDPRDVRREAAAAVRDEDLSDEERRRAVHDLAHGRAADVNSRWLLRNTIQDRYLDEGHRTAMLLAHCRCDPEGALESLDLFARSSSHDAFARLGAAMRMHDPLVRRRAVLALATAADIDPECRLKAAIALKPLARRDAEAALQNIATDGIEVGFEVRIQAAAEWAVMNREAAIDALWRIVLATGTPWYWRIAAAAKLVVLRVRAAYDLLCDWLENPELPAEAQAQLSMTLDKLEARRA
ncbi:hypothetical protein GCM10009830_20020 [Glycomyces endophyticus]|uniref:HEAT repeat domain-containing protein n=1 Tax=Glycomyces endophyticus TaxID=480996 RepID=A0ABN2GMD1_9ACTN